MGPVCQAPQTGPWACGPCSDTGLGTRTGSRDVRDRLASGVHAPRHRLTPAEADVLRLQPVKGNHGSSCLPRPEAWWRGVATASWGPEEPAPPRGSRPCPATQAICCLSGRKTEADGGGLLHLQRTLQMTGARGARRINRRRRRGQRGSHGAVRAPADRVSRAGRDAQPEGKASPETSTLPVPVSHFTVSRTMNRKEVALARSWDTARYGRKAARPLRWEDGPAPRQPVHLRLAPGP